MALFYLWLEVASSELDGTLRVFRVCHLQLPRAAAPVPVVELGDAPAADTVDRELAEALHQLALPLPPEEDALLVDDAHLKRKGVMNLDFEVAQATAAESFELSSESSFFPCSSLKMGQNLATVVNAKNSGFKGNRPRMSAACLLES